MRNNRSVNAFFFGMLLFFLFVALAMATMITSFTATYALSVFVNFIFSMFFTGGAYLGFLVAADGWAD